MPPIVEYRFINGNGNDAHAAKLNDAAKEGWTIVNMIFDPDGIPNNERVVVLLRKP